MLDSLRKSSSSFFAWIILGALALAFGLSFGLPSDSLSFGSSPIVKVHGTAIEDTDYRVQYTLIRGFVGVPKDERMQKALGVKEEVLESAIEREILAHAAEDMGLAATQLDAEDLVANGHIVLLGDTRYWTGLDQFNFDVFKNFLRGVQVSENDYYELQERELLARTARDLIRSSVVVSEPELRAQYDESANQVSLRYARYEFATFADLVDPSSEDIDAWVAAHSEELGKTLETQGARFNKLPAQVRISVIEVGKPAPEAGEEKLAEAREAIAAVAKRLADGEDFRKVAREVSTHETAKRGGDFGWITIASGTGIDLAVDAILSEIKEGETSAVLEGENGLYLVKATGKREGDVPNEVALRELAEEAVKESKGKELAKQAAEADLAKIDGGSSLATVFDAPGLGDGGGIEDAPIDGEGEDGGDAETPAADEGLLAGRPKAPLRETGLFSKDGSIPGLGLIPGLVDAAWASSTETELLDEVFETQGALLVAGLEKKETGSDEGFAEARADLYRAAWQRKSNTVTANWAERECLEAKGTGDIVVTQEKVERIITYDAPDAKDAKAPEDDPNFKPYSVCDRVGMQGGLLRSGLLSGGGR